MNPQLVIYGTDAEYLKTLKGASTSLPYIGYEFGFGPEVVQKAGLGAIWATPFAALELFGAAPPYPMHEARVVKTPPGQLQRGMPRYGIVGVATSRNDPKDPEYNLRLVLSSLLKAVNEFNSRSGDVIRRVGILPEDLDLRRLEPNTAFGIIRDIYERYQLSGA